MPSTTKLQSCLPLLCPKSPPKPYSPACKTVASSCKVCKSALHHSGFNCHPFFAQKNSSSPPTVIYSNNLKGQSRLQRSGGSSGQFNFRTYRGLCRAFQPGIFHFALCSFKVQKASPAMHLLFHRISDWHLPWSQHQSISMTLRQP